MVEFIYYWNGENNIWFIFFYINRIYFDGKGCLFIFFFILIISLRYIFFENNKMYLGNLFVFIYLFIEMMYNRNIELYVLN